MLNRVTELIIALGFGIIKMKITIGESPKRV